MELTPKDYCRVLLVEDNPGDARLIQLALAENAYTHYDIVHVTALSDAIQRIAQERFDVALLDLSLPDSQELDTMRRLHSAAPELPIVVLSGTNDERLAMQAVHEGAQEYLIKDEAGGSVVSRALAHAKERSRLSLALAESERRYRHLVDNSRGLICIHEPNGKLAYVNPTAAESLGYTPAEMIGGNLRDYLVPEMQPRLDAYLTLVVKQRRHVGLMRMQTRAGDTRIWSYDNVCYQDVQFGDRILGYAQDITELQRTQEAIKASEERFRLLANRAPVGILITDLDGNCSYVNDHWYRITGMNAEQALGQGWKQGVHADDLMALTTAWQGPTSGAAGFEIEFRYTAERGGPIWVHLNAAVLHDNAGKAVGQLGILVDITERKRAHESLTLLAQTDELTGLYNRRGFNVIADQSLKLARRYKRKLALFSLDLDGMKQINDRYGHHMGDQALIDTANILRQALRDSDIIARFGGDEFAILAPETDVAGAEIVLTRLRDRLTAHNAAAERPYVLAFSIGVTHYDATVGGTLEEMIAAADTAMYECKRIRKESPEK